MGRKYNIQPTIKHYGCVVDLLGRASLVEEAYNLIKTMPVECNAIVLRTLLVACRLHGCVELGEKVRKHLLELEPDHSSDYVLLANMYASTGKWNEMSRERRSMQQRKVQKPEPRNSFIGIPGLRLEKGTIATLFSRLIQDGAFQSQLINREDGVACGSCLNAFSVTFSCKVNGPVMV
ncbi:hypothetical protein Fmac_026789 [Flemingia macrophylla]|uniref:Pentatricopeptide repeat-containing protein n=1 Tax=Flemingia macrophylla TaxID=520843 RepID=A0ABD1LFU7_9FABA